MIKSKKDAYYFSHDSNARNDEKLLDVRIAHDWRGYGLYWAIVESLRDATDYRLQCNYNKLAFSLQCDIEILESIIKDFDLFVIENGYFYSESLNHRMAMKEDKSQKARDSANIRWNKNANAIQPQCDSNASKVKKRKENERKVNPERAEAIERILKLYPKVVLHNAALMSVGNAIQREVDKGQDEQIVIVMIEKAVKAYKNSLEDTKYAKQAVTWFNNGGYLATIKEQKPKQSRMVAF